MLAEAMNILASYLIFFRSNYNQKFQDYEELKHQFNKKLMIAMQTHPQGGSTVKEREGKTILQSEELQQLQEKVYQYQTRVSLLEKFPEEIKEKLNVYKKVYDARCEERKYGHR